MKKIIILVLLCFSVGVFAQQQKPAPVTLLDTTVKSMRHVVVLEDSTKILLPISHYVIVDSTVVRKDPYVVYNNDPIVLYEVSEIIKKHSDQLRKEIRNIVIQNFLKQKR